MKVWKTKEGKEIPYKDLELSHLKNIIKLIEKKAKNGFIIYSGGGDDPDDFYYSEYELSIEETKKHFDYYGLKKELKSREGG